MRVSLTLLVLAACVALCACAQDGCYAQITAKARDGASWYVGATHYQIYDITVTNMGSCVLTRIVGIFTPKEAGGFISEAWNYDAPSGVFSGYGSQLAMGQSFYGAGFVLANATMPMLGLTRPGCPDSCPQGTSAPTTATPTTTAPTTATPTTTAPTTKAPTTAAPTTTAPTTMAPTTTAGPSSCRVAASIARDSNWWMDSQGRNTSVYRITMTNYGPCSLVSYIAAINIYNGTVISYWNLVTVQGGYKVTGYGPSLASGSTFSAAGLIIAGAPDLLSISQYSSSCGC